MSHLELESVAEAEQMMAGHVLSFQSAVSPVDAVQRAAYRMSDRISCELTVDGDAIRCSVHVIPGGDVGALIAEFRNEVLDETLRARVREETREVRNLILALAFSNTGLIESEDA